jgi:alpha-glucoside transport system permease protein
VPAASTAFGLLAAQLTDRISWGNIAKSLIFMPMAISFVGAAVIFKLIYDTRPSARTRSVSSTPSGWLSTAARCRSVSQGRSGALDRSFCGLMAYAIYQTCVRFSAGKGAWPIALVGSCPARCHRNCCGVDDLAVVGAIVSLFTATLPYGEPQTWLTIPFWNNFFLMVVLIWIQTGFAMVILSAALRGIPEETIEAAVIDGANPFQIFFKIKVPQIMGTIVVVWTTITLVVLKVFDIVFAMTNGQWETQVLANYMYDKLFRANDWGVGSASAIVIMLLVTPILVWNVYNARKEMR